MNFILVIQDVHEAWVMPKVVDITKKTKNQAPLSNQLVEEISRLQKLKLRTQQLQVKFFPLFPPKYY